MSEGYTRPTQENVYDLWVQGQFKDYKPGTLGKLVEAVRMTFHWDLIVRTHMDNQESGRFNLMVIKPKSHLRDEGREMLDSERREVMRYVNGFLDGRRKIQRRRY